MRLAGIIITAAGVAMAGLTVGAWVYYAQLPSCPDPNPPGSLCPLGQGLEGGPRLALAVSATVVSVGSLVTGGVLWGVGAKKIRRAREMTASAQPFVVPVQGGVMAGLRLVAF